jgi:hypothetical protein
MTIHGCEMTIHGCEMTIHGCDKLTMTELLLLATSQTKMLKSSTTKSFRISQYERQ